MLTGYFPHSNSPGLEICLFLIGLYEEVTISVMVKLALQTSLKWPNVSIVYDLGTSNRYIYDRHSVYSLLILYLRNLLTHTVNNLLRKLNNVKSIQFFVVKHIFNIINIMCEIFTTIPWVLYKIQLF